MKNRLIQRKGKWSIVVEDGMGNVVSRTNYANREAAMEARSPKRKKPAGDSEPVRVNRTRPPVTADELPGETVTAGTRSTVAEEKMPADDQPMRLAKDKGRAPPPIKQVNKPLRGR